MAEHPVNSPGSWFLGWFLPCCQPSALIFPLPVRGDASFGFGFDHGFSFTYYLFYYIISVTYLEYIICHFYLEGREDFLLSSLSPMMGSDPIKTVLINFLLLSIK